MFFKYGWRQLINSRTNFPQEYQLHEVKNVTFATVFRTRCSKCNPSDPWAMKVTLLWKMTLLLLNCSAKWLLLGQSCSITAPLSLKHINTWFNYQDRQGHNLKSRLLQVQRTEDFNCTWVLIHAIHHGKGLSNVKSLAKSSKNMFIQLFIYEGHSQEKSSHNDCQNLHSSQGKLHLKLAYKRCVNVFFMYYYSTYVVEHNSSSGI